MELYHRDQIGLFLVHLIEEDPKVLSLFSLSELADLYAQEMGLTMNEQVKHIWTGTTCSILFDLITSRPPSAKRMKTRTARNISHLAVQNNSLHLQSTKDPRINSPIVHVSSPVCPSIQHSKINCETPTESSLKSVTNQNPSVSSTKSATTTPLFSDSLTQLRESIFQRLVKPTTRLPGDQSSSLITSSSPRTPSSSSITHTSLITLRPVTTNTVANISNASESVRLSTPSTKPSSVITPLHVNVSLVSPLSGSSTLNSSISIINPQNVMVVPPNDSPPYITVQRKLNEAVISVRPAPSRLLDKL